MDHAQHLSRIAQARRRRRRIPVVTHTVEPHADLPRLHEQADGPGRAPRQRIGTQAETRAAAMLQRQGMRLIARNLRCRLGEIDLVMLDAQTLVFVEVRRRNHDRYGSAADSITRHKQLRLIRAARYFLPRLSTRLQLPASMMACRFDVVLEDGLAAPVWIRQAFDCTPC